MYTIKKLREIGKVRCRRVYDGMFHAGNHEQFIQHLLGQLDYLKSDLMAMSETERCQELERQFQVKLSPAAVKKIEFTLSEDGGPNLTVLVNGKKSNRFIMLPKIEKELTGTLEFRSKDYRFLADGKEDFSYGPDLRREHLTDYGLMIDAGSGRIHYYIED